MMTVFNYFELYAVTFFIFLAFRIGDVSANNLAGGGQSGGESPLRLNMKTAMYLFTRKNPNEAFPFYPENDVDVLSGSYFDLNAKTLIVIGGWMCKWNEKIILYMVSELLIKEDCNVIIVSWTENLLNGLYHVAIQDAKKAGVQVGKFFKRLNKRKNFSPKQIHIIGHSLGAHMAGEIGTILKTVGRISGLDPAGPFLELAKESDRLDPTDAIFVDVIHTSDVGYFKPCGHVDFYPDGGRKQSVCNLKEMTTQLKAMNESRYLEYFMSCDHLQAFFYFVKSINGNCSYKAISCADYSKFQRGLCACDTKGSQCIEMGYGTTYLQPKPSKMGFYLNPKESKCK